MIIENIAKAIKKSGKSRYQISKDTGIDQAVLCRIANGGRCGIETADVLYKHLGMKLMAKKQKNKRVLSKADLQEMLTQVNYEYNMLSHTAARISKIKDGPEKNAMLESFLIHVRNLIDFFYIDTPSIDDDVLAVDYFSSPKDWITKRGKFPQYLKDAKIKANKLLSHITLSRIKKYKGDKGWQVLKIKGKIDNILECFMKEKTF